MKIHIKRNRRGDVSVAFKAGQGREGVDLKEAILAACTGGKGVDVTRVLEELEKRGYDFDGVEKTTGGGE